MHEGRGVLKRWLGSSWYVRVCLLAIHYVYSRQHPLFRSILAMDASVLRTIHLSSLPDISNPEMDFYETSFFRPASSTSPSGPSPQLPPPSLVLETGKGRGSRVVKFEHLNFVVKFGPPSKVKLEEAQAMWAIGHLFPAKEVPVPELFGWRVDQGQNFIYMSLIKGPTLGEV